MKTVGIALPVLLGIAVLALWQGLVGAYHVPAYVLPGPIAIVQSLVENFASLMGSAWVTLRITAFAFLAALVSGVALAILFSQARLIEAMFYPYAVILQVTPIFAIAPLILIWVGFERVELAQLILAWVAAFFPILSNTTLGLRSADRNLVDLFRLYGASRVQILARLRFPSALPYLLSGMKIAGGLSLVGTVIADFAAGSGTSTGLGWRILEASHRLEVAKEFAALLLLSVMGIAIFFALSWLERRMLRHWHDSALAEGN